MPVLTLKQADEYLGESEGFTRDLIEAGEISYEDRRRPGSKVPRYRVDSLELDRWRTSRHVKSFSAVAPPLVRGGATGEGADLLAQKLKTIHARKGA